VTVEVLLVGPRGHGGEDVYVNSIRANAPEGVAYRSAGDFHKGAPGAPCNAVAEILLNRLVYPRTIPDIGFRSLRIKSHFDLVHVHAHPTRLTRLGRIPLVLSEGSSPIVYVEQYLGWDKERLQAALRKSRRLYRLLGVNDRLLALERASKAYVFSHWARELQVQWGADPDKTEVIYPGFETPAVPERPEREEFRFLFVGRDFERKGGFEVVEAFERIQARAPHARLTVAGSDPARRNPDRLIHDWVPAERRERTLAQLAKLQQRGLADVRPWVDREVLVREIYPTADAFVMPPHAEGFGFTNVEAMSFGLPVITSTVGPGAELVREGKTGLLVEPGNADAIAGAMVQLMTDPARARGIGAAARADFLERFTLDRFRTNLGDLYTRAMSS
jgi:glycosyltransferase involved in cell wall biosynthesis